MIYSNYWKIKYLSVRFIDILSQSSIISSMEREIKARLSWVKLYIQTENAGLVCQRCGISRPTLRKRKWRRC